MRVVPLFLVLAGLPFIGVAIGNEAEKKAGVAAEKESPPKVAGNLDIKNSKDGSYPGGATPKAGKWKVDASAKKLKIDPLPLVEGWLEFGPEIRERGATVTAIARAPGDGRLQSRFGAGLYGKNGYQLRAVLVSDHLQLVRRREVLEEIPVKLEPGQAYHVELSILPVAEEDDEEKWRLEGRLWPHESKRPAQAMITREFLLEELLFPLAGRTVITATPFSGESVAFRSATSYYGEYSTPDPEVEGEEALEGEGDASKKEGADKEKRAEGEKAAKTE